jgi:hypothetical protein
MTESDINLVHQYFDPAMELDDGLGPRSRIGLNLIELSEGRLEFGQIGALLVWFAAAPRLADVVDLLPNLCQRHALFPGPKWACGANTAQARFNPPGGGLSATNVCLR